MDFCENLFAKVFVINVKMDLPIKIIGILNLTYLRKRIVYHEYIIYNSKKIKLKTIKNKFVFTNIDHE